MVISPSFLHVILKEELDVSLRDWCTWSIPVSKE